jgi:hypothetical protein
MTTEETRPGFRAGLDNIIRRVLHAAGAKPDKEQSCESLSLAKSLV